MKNLSLAGLVAAFGLSLLCPPAAAQSREVMRQVEEAQRRQEERTRKLDEVQRLQRIGRFDEASALMRQIEESYSPEERAEMRGAQGTLQDLMRQMGVEMPQGFELPDLSAVGDMADFGRDAIEMTEQFIPEPLFVRPAQLWSGAGSYGQMVMRLPGPARTLWQQGMGRLSAGDFPDAEAKLSRALEIVREQRGAADAGVALVLEGFGRLEHARGNPAAAIARLQSAIEVVQKLRGGNPQWVAHLLWIEAMVHGTSGAAARAVAVCEQALPLAARSGEQSGNYAIALNNLGVAFHQQGDLARARQLYEQSAALLRAPRPQRALFNAPPVMIGGEGPGGDASARMRELMAGRMGELMGGSESRAAGSAAGAAQMPRLAAPTFDPAEDTQIMQVNLSYVAANLGLLQWQLGDLSAAREQFRAALDARAEMEKANDPFATEKGALAKASALAVELDALHTLERRAAGTNAGGDSVSLQALLERKGAVLERQARAMETFRAGMTAALPEQPGFFAGMTAAGQMQKIEREQQQRQQGEDQEVMAEYKAALAERAALAQRTPASAEQQAEQRRRIADLDRRLSAMQQQIQMRAQERQSDIAPTREELRQMSGRPDVQALTDGMQRRQDARRAREREQRVSLLPSIQARLPQGAVLLEMLKYRPLDPRVNLPEEKRWGGARYGVFLIRASGAPEYVDLGEAAPIEQLVTPLRKALAERREAARELGRKLDALVMQPLRARMAGASLLWVAPEGMLNLVPFGALVDEQSRYLVERYTFNYLGSGRDLLRAQTPLPARGPALIIADPAFDLRAAGTALAAAGQRSRSFDGLRFERLPGTVEEAQALKKLLPDAIVLTGAQATESAAKAAVAPRILHIATHGFFLEDMAQEGEGGRRSLKVSPAAPESGNPAAVAENPMVRSGLVFAGVNALSSGTDDGVLTALEASGLDLNGTRLVVLSACETGLGQVRNGEGVFGLRRAFAVAGAETLVMSLWQVADEATKDLMIGYYSRLAKGEGRAEALRQTQLGMLKEEKYAHPFFWAAFISSGESGSLK